MTLASDTIAFGKTSANRSPTAYQTLPPSPHFARWRSMPSTFSATSVPRSRGSPAKTALATLPSHIAS